jgi:HEAT repeat protein
MLWGLGRLAEVHPDLLPEFGPLIVPFLTNPDPELRALAAWCLGKLDYGEAREDLRSLLEDDTPVQLYDREALHRTSVGQLAREALQRLELKER